MKTFFAALMGSFLGTIMAFSVCGVLLIGFIGVAGAQIKQYIQKVEAENGGQNPFKDAVTAMQQMKQLSRGVSSMSTDSQSSSQ